MKCDLAIESEILAMFDNIRQKFGRIDVCINNAGFAIHSPLLSGETSDWRNMLEVNVLALCICNRESIKIMQEKNINDGQIINISRMERWSGRVALVTGASAGIGAGICRELVKYGVNVVACARRLKRIEELAEEKEVKACPGRLHAVKCDLTQESEITDMFNIIRTKFGRIDICINNAGFSTDSPLLSGETSDWKGMLEVNVLALSICSREAVKLMREEGIDDGQIIQISSLGGHKLPSTTAMPGLNFYCGTKFMVRALTEGLRREVKNAKTRIRVASVSPGLVETEFLSRLLTPETLKGLCSSLECLQPKDIAEAVMYILKAPPHVDINDIIVQSTDMSD